MPKYNKLIRDLIPDLIAAHGNQAQIQVLEEAAYVTALRQKLYEEVAEFDESGEVEELADILEVVYALAQQMGIERADLEAIRREKATRRGGFAKRLFLVETT
ncbi:nucleoside triphosphate pyrophosphohydrolase [Anaerolineales bacterium HSG24]|nr:nucleoside triphosphate pyrophosphohydrolase [Anaerolineales bacterium HSG24]